LDVLVGVKTLCLIRHAKSSWKFPELADFDRPLNKRGLKAAPMMAELLQKMVPKVDHVLSSASRRTLDTAHFFMARYPHLPGMAISEELYECTGETMWEVIRALPDAANTVLMVGHLTGIEAILTAIAPEPLQKIPTASISIVKIDVTNWQEAGMHNSHLQALYFPKALTG
jgi:phosphohistidine phosphatase